MINFKKMRLRIKQWLQGIKIKQKTVNAITVAVVAVLGLFFVLQLATNISGSVSTLKAQIITDIDSISLKGYIFRDEKMVYASGQVANFNIDNGQRMGVGQQVATLYSLSSKKSQMQVQSELNAMTERIRLLESGIVEAKSLSQSSEIFEDIDASYYSFLSAVENKNFSLADKEEKLFIDALNSYMVATGRTDEAQSIVNSLTKEKESFISQNLSGTPTPLKFEESCYFYTSYDGYEDVFDYSRVMEMTPSEFKELTLSEKKEYSTAIGKQVFSPLWYICFPVSDQVCDRFVNNLDEGYDEYDTRFVSDNNENVILTFEKAVYADAEGNSGFIVFSTRQMPEDFDFLRAQNVEIEMSSRTGYRVPAEAVEAIKYGKVKGEDEDVPMEGTVYVLNGSTVEKKTFTINGIGEGYYIANTYKAEQGNHSNDRQHMESYLSDNDLIIISGRNLYDGKLLS